jgi:hypothetical protein
MNAFELNRLTVDEDRAIFGFKRSEPRLKGKVV